MNSKRHRDRGEWVTSEETIWNDWHVISHWFRVDGQVIPAGIDIRSFTSSDGGDGSLPLAYGVFDNADVPQSITRGDIAGIPVGRILRDHRTKATKELQRRAEQILHPWADTQTVATAEEWTEWGEGLRLSQPRRGYRDNLHQAVARFYTEAIKDGWPSPAEYVRTCLEIDPQAYDVEHELDPDRNEVDKRARVRKWIAAARKKGYLSPVEKVETERKEDK